MIDSMKRLLLGFLLTVLVSGFAAAARLDLTEQENGKDILLDRGDELVVRLASNRTTGYSWGLEMTGNGRLEQQGEALYETLRSDRRLMGAGGVEVWKFRAVRKGGVVLKFNYCRPWEKDVPPVKTVSWPVTIRP